MLQEGQQRGYPILKFLGNRLKIERMVEKGRLETRPWVRRGSIETILSEDDLRDLLRVGTDVDETSEGEDFSMTALEDEVAVVSDEEDEKKGEARKEL